MTIFALAADGAGDLALRGEAELGEILVDSTGSTLYLFVPDARGESTCYDACAENWPPLVVVGDVVVGEGLSQDLVGAVTRTDGTEQVTYGGWPLYTFARDTEPGQVAGQGLNEVWFVLNAEGAPVGMPEASPAATEEDAAQSAEGGDEMAALMNEGATVFARICSACHGANGNEALVEHAAILADNDRLENERRVLRRVIHGGGYMPGFGSILSDREVAAVTTFVRNSWGNEFGIVGEEAATGAR